jgi:hypothetical protein
MTSQEELIAMTHMVEQNRDIIFLCVVCAFDVVAS